MAGTLVPLVEDLAFAEGPRWHDGKLWFSDMHSHVVHTFDPATGSLDRVVEVPNRPSGLGWRPDGTLLIVSMTDRRVLGFRDGVLDEIADLSNHASWHCNDMIVASNGDAYVGNFGFDIYDADADPTVTSLTLVPASGEVRNVVDDLFFPNGMAITPDGSTMIVGETYGAVLTAFTIESDGSLSNRREWARVQGAVPDGICLDAEGAIWMASPIDNRVVRVAEGGEILDEIRTSDERQPFACMLGGDDGQTLFVCTALESEPEKAARLRAGRIDTVRVDSPRAGLP